AAVVKAVNYLLRAQRPDGAWVPLWFGHQENPADENPLYGTARVLPAFCELAVRGGGGVAAARDRALRWLIGQQARDGGWSGAAGAAGSTEETALALEALAVAWDSDLAAELRGEVKAALQRGAEWLPAAVESGRWREPAPIGFYFAKLWYFERLYPVIFATGALVRLAQLK
ncbi:MAG: prenyltransferase/squalene oxidase repeat-containing protein, partial [Verrucomicrobiota bacterium]